MYNLTKKAIRASFTKLLEEMPLSRITVRRIVEDCGINRNSFYYHYDGIPALMEEIARDETDRLIAAYPTVDQLEDGVKVLFSSLVERRKAIRHIYNSVNRDIYERYLMQVCEYIVTAYLNTAFAGVDIAEEDRALAVRFFKCELFGLSFDWINNGMKEEAVEQVQRTLQVCRGLSDDLIRRARETRPPAPPQ